MIPTFQMGQFGRTIIESVASGDPCFSSVLLLMHGDGSDGATSTIDSSSYGRTVSRTSPSTLSATQSKFGGTSLNISTGRFSVPASTDFDFGTSDFCLEAWLYRTSSGAIENTLMTDLLILGDGTATNRSFYISFVLTTVQARFTYDTNSEVLISGSFSTSLVNRWAHIAVTREGNTFRLFVDGVLEASVTESRTIKVNQGAVCIGASNWYGGSGDYIDDVRITKGCARYTADFTTPTEAFQDF